MENRSYRYLTPIFLLYLFLLSGTTVMGQTAVDKKTAVYSIKDNDTLRLDVYSNPLADTAGRPCLLYVFGGAFVVGKRDEAERVAFFEKMVNSGFNVVSIDYRLGFRKAFGDPTDGPTFAANMKQHKPMEFLDIFYGSINMAVEDLFDATTYIVDHAEELHIDPDKIIPLGSSAGAVTVLQGQNYIANSTEMATDHLPANFSYAGTISMAGAIFSMKGDLQWKQNPSPMLLFHGDADRQVPYDKARIKILLFPLKFGFYGSKHIAAQLEKHHAPFWFYSVENAGHEVAVTPMDDHINEILSFYDKYIVQQQQLAITTNHRDQSVPTKKKKFGFKDYIQGNFGG